MTAHGGGENGVRNKSEKTDVRKGGALVSALQLVKGPRWSTEELGGRSNTGSTWQ